MATEVLERYHSLYINVPDSLQEAMRRVERKLMELLVEILSCEYLKDEECNLFRRNSISYWDDTELFRRLLHYDRLFTFI